MSDGLTIVTQSVLDNVDARQVEFTAVLEEERHDFAVRYEVLEALSGIFPLTEAVATFHTFAGQVAGIAPRAIERGTGVGRILVTETDLAASDA